MKQTSMIIGGNEYTAVLMDEFDDCLSLLEHLSTRPVLSIDLETTGLQWYGADRIAGIAIYDPENRTAYYITTGHIGSNNYNIFSLVYELTNLFRSDREIIGWNFKFDMNFLQAAGVRVLDNATEFQCYDAMIGLHLLDENRYDRSLNYKLKDNAVIFIDKNANAAESELKARLAAHGKAKGQMYELPAEQVYEYACADTILAYLLHNLFMEHLAKWGQVELYRELNKFLVDGLLRMEQEGMLVDRSAIRVGIDTSDAAAVDTLARIRELAGFDLNPNSPKQVSTFLEIADAKRATLDAMKDNELAGLIVDYKFLSKAVGTFYQPYLEYSMYDDRIHPNLNITGTVSGRLSSSQPNLQQVPRKPKEGQKGYNVKSVFIAPEGFKLVQLDYHAQELRLAAHFAKEEKITDIFNAGGDPHQLTADMLGIDRQTGKTLNFGLLYGMGVAKAATFLKISEAEAEELVPAWHKLYPAFKRKHYELIDEVRRAKDPQGNYNYAGDNGYNYLRLADGRVRHFFGENAPIYSVWNNLIQGTGATIIRRAILALANAYRFSDTVKLSMTVHDSVIMYIREDVVAQELPTIMNIMTDFPEYNPLMKVEASIGDSWGALT